MEELIAARDTLLKRVVNFKKSINHPYTKEFLESVKVQTSEILDKVRKFQADSDLVQRCEIGDIFHECEWLGAQIVKFIKDHAGDSAEEHASENTAATMAVTFRDVEQSLTRFNGSAQVEKWLEDFEATSTVYEWTELQRYVYCRQLLEGAAQLAITTKRSINSFATLKAFLLEEFASEVNSADLHDQLRKMQKEKNESSVVFGYRVLAVAGKGTIDMKATLSYIVRGLGTSCNNKATLLVCSTWKDLRKMLMAQDQANDIDSSARGSGYRPYSAGTVSKPVIKSEQFKQEPGEKPKCFKCGIVGHISRNCRKNNGNCFKCGQPGHLAAQCNTAGGAPVVQNPV